MTLSYQELFDQRGSAYDRAMRLYPNARKNEFMQAIEAAQLKHDMVVADVPAGGGYMQAFLPNGCIWQGHEPCASFGHHVINEGNITPLLPLPWANESVDAAISLAGLHHIEDKRPLFADLLRVVKPKGKLVISDVATDSKVAHFLDGYVGANNSTGHDGIYLDQHTLQDLAQVGWNIESSSMADFLWEFNGRQQMATFCHGLFVLRRSTEDETLDAIESILGVEELADGRVGMHWSLMTVVSYR